jgi:carboxypeptidase C (cathepsin A)
VLNRSIRKLVKPQCSRRLGTSVLGARLKVVRGGHMVPYTHPTAVAGAVQSVVR